MGGGLILYILIKLWRFFRWLRLPLPWDDPSTSARTPYDASDVDESRREYNNLPYEKRAPKPLKERKEHTVSEELTYLSEQLHDWAMRADSFSQKYGAAAALWNALLKRRTQNGWEYASIFDDPKTRDAVLELRDFCAFIDRLCLAYWEADDAWREWLRQAEHPFRHLSVIAYIEKQNNAARAASQVEPLRLALAAISIDNWTTVPSTTLMPSDELDMSGYLLTVITAARDARVDLTPHVLQMAALSSDKPSRAHPNSISMREMMEHNSQYR